MTAAYTAGKVTILDLNVATFPVEKSGCIPDWNCASWSSCTAGKETRSCTDQNICNLDKLTKKETRSCGAAVAGAEDSLECSYHWDCAQWGVCIGSQQLRTCTRIDDCDAQFAAGTVSSVVEYAQPTESQSCIAGLAGSLPLKTAGAPAGLPKSTMPPAKEDISEQAGSEQAGLSLWVYVGIVVILLGIIGLWLVLRRRTAPPAY